MASEKKTYFISGAVVLVLRSRENDKWSSDRDGVLNKASSLETRFSSFASVCIYFFFILNRFRLANRYTFVNICKHVVFAVAFSLFHSDHIFYCVCRQSLWILFILKHTVATKPAVTIRQCAYLFLPSFSQFFYLCLFHFPQQIFCIYFWRIVIRIVQYNICRFKCMYEWILFFVLFRPFDLPLQIHLHLNSLAVGWSFSKRRLNSIIRRAAVTVTANATVTMTSWKWIFFFS